jgi:hypothetical protein
LQMQRALYFICSATPTDSICCFVTSYEERAPRLTLGTEYPPQSQSLSKGSHFLRALSHHARGSCQNCTSRAGLLPKQSHRGSHQNCHIWGSHFLRALSHHARGSHQNCTSRAGLLPKHSHQGALTKTVTSGALTKLHMRGALTKTAHLSIAGLSPKLHTILSVGLSPKLSHRGLTLSLDSRL